MYLIQASNGSLRYWVQVLSKFQKGRTPHWRFTGLIENATKFNSFLEASDVFVEINPRSSEIKLEIKKV